MIEKRLYFAYGSNCNIPQMDYRCPRATNLGAATLEGYQVEFRYVASIRPQAGSAAQGVLWDITPDCERVLDKYEGFPRLYIKDTVTVTDSTGASVEAMVYIMAAGAGREISPPSDSYYNCIVEGFQSHGIGDASLVEARAEATAAASKDTTKAGRRLKLAEKRSYTRFYIDESLLTRVNDFVHKEKRTNKGYSRSDLANAALAQFLENQTGSERQAQKKRPVTLVDGYGDQRVTCPACGKGVTNYWSPGTKPAFCQFCGQGIDWEGDNNG